MKLFILLFSLLSSPTDSVSKPKFEISAGIGQRGLIDKKEFVFRSTITAAYIVPINPVISFSINADALYYDDPRQNLLISWSNEKWAYGTGIGAETNLNKVVFLLGMYRYLYFNSVYNTNNPDDLVQHYTKLGFRYRITPSIGIGFIMRAHRNQADYIEYGLSFRF